MKLIIDVDEQEYKTILANAKLYKDKSWGSADVWDAILNGIPYEPKGDLISREALKEQFNHLEMVTNNSSLIEQAEYKMLMTCISLIDNAPTVEYTFEEAFQKTVCESKLYCPERPQGEWIRKVDEVGFISHICSECGAEIEVEDTKDDKFCFSCGADMRKGGNAQPINMPKPNCVTCDHFGKCEGCKKREEE